MNTFLSVLIVFCIPLLGLAAVLPIRRFGLIAFSVYAGLEVICLGLIQKFRQQIGHNARRGLQIEAVLQGLFAGVFPPVAISSMFQSR